MDFLAEFFAKFGSQLQSPTLGFLLGGIIIAALGSRLEIPDAIYKFIVFMLLIKVGLSGGIAIRNSNITEMLLPALFAMLLGILIVFIASYTLAKLPGIRTVDALATGGLFGAVSGSTLAAGITVLEGQGIEYEAWAGALYPFMDIPALVTAIVLASLYTRKRKRDKYLKNEEYLRKESVAVGGYAAGADGSEGGYASESGGSLNDRVQIWPIIQESLQGSALSALLLGLALGLITRPESVLKVSMSPSSVVCFQF